MKTLRDPVTPLKGMRLEGPPAIEPEGNPSYMGQNAKRKADKKNRNKGKGN